MDVVAGSEAVAGLLASGAVKQLGEDAGGGLVAGIVARVRKVFGSDARSVDALERVQRDGLSAAVSELASALAWYAQRDEAFAKQLTGWAAEAARAGGVTQQVRAGGDAYTAGDLNVTNNYWPSVGPQELEALDRATGGPAVVGDIPQQPPPGDPMAPGLLPRDVPGFTGREGELDRLTALAARGGRVVVTAIGGTAGVGKTALAVHAAHRLLPEFPDGQLYADLRGYTVGQTPAEPGEVLEVFLRRLGRSDEEVPARIEERSGLLRQLLKPRRVLMVLDNTADEAQVRPLLPGAGDSLVIITSRSVLPGLEADDRIDLDALSEVQAVELLAGLIGPPRAAADPEAVAQVAGLCGRLPLALRIAGQILAVHPSWPVARLAGTLADERDRLAWLAAGDLQVRAAFEVSYAQLADGDARMFRLLGLHPGPDFDVLAAASLAGIEDVAAGAVLDRLVLVSLVSENASGRRFGMHGLLRLFARQTCQEADDQATRDGAQARLVDYYTDLAGFLGACLDPRQRLATEQAGVSLLASRETLARFEIERPSLQAALADRDLALAWARAERANLLACLDQVTRTDQHARIIALTTGLAALLLHDGPWDEAINRHTKALDSARYLDDWPGQANALNNRGMVREATGYYKEAADDLEEALGIYRKLVDRPGQANALTSLGNVRRLTDRYPAAERDLEEALGIFREIGDRPGMAEALTFLGDVQRMTGHYPEATQALEKAHCICRQLGDRSGMAYALFFLGDVRRRTRDYQEAARDLKEALGIYRDIGYMRGQANALTFLGRLRRVTEDYPEAADDLEEALGICGDIGYRGAKAEALNESGTLHHVRRDLPQAESYHQQALNLAGKIESSWDEAQALAGLGRCARAADDPAKAEELLRHALEIFQRIGTAETAEVSAELKDLTDQ